MSCREAANISSLLSHTKGELGALPDVVRWGVMTKLGSSKLSPAPLCSKEGFWNTVGWSSILPLATGWRPGPEVCLVSGACLGLEWMDDSAVDRGEVRGSVRERTLMIS